MKTLLMSDGRGPEVVKELVLRLAYDQELQWIEAICQELVQEGAFSLYDMLN